MLIIPIVAWGKHHINTARFCLASLKSDGNLPDVEAHVKIYTDEPLHFKGYETAPLKTTGGRHEITTACFIDALSQGYPIVPIASDMIASVGMLAALEGHARTKRLVMVPVLRTDASSMLSALEAFMEEIPLEPKGRLTLTSRQLCYLAFENIHPRILLQFLENMPSPSYPTTIFARRDETTISARCFHMHPLLLRPGDIRQVTPSIDGEMVSRFAENEIHIVTDSDEMVVCDISDTGYNWNGPNRAMVDPVAFANRKTINRHRWFFTHECYLHSGELEKFAPDPRMTKLLADVASLPSR